MSEAHYLISQPCSSLEQSLAGVLVHNQPTSLWRDRTHRGGLDGRCPVHPHHLRCDAACSAVCLGLRGGWTEGGGGARLDWRAGIMIRRGGSLPLGATLLTQLRRKGDGGRERQRERDTVTALDTRTHTHTDGHSRAHGD